MSDSGTGRAHASVGDRPGRVSVPVAQALTRVAGVLLALALALAPVAVARRGRLGGGAAAGGARRHGCRRTEAVRGES